MSTAPNKPAIEFLSTEHPHVYAVSHTDRCSAIDALRTAKMRGSSVDNCNVHLNIRFSNRALYDINGDHPYRIEFNLRGVSADMSEWHITVSGNYSNCMSAVELESFDAYIYKLVIVAASHTKHKLTDYIRSTRGKISATLTYNIIKSEFFSHISNILLNTKYVLSQ